MRKYVSLIIFGVYILFQVVPMLDLNFEGNSIEIPSYEAVITINDAGDMNIVESWNMVYNEQMTVRFRDIVYDKYGDGYPLYEDSGNKAYFDETNVGVAFYKDGIDVSDDIVVGYSFEGDLDERFDPVECYPAVPYCESIFVNTYRAGYMEGNVTFEYDYTILGAVTQYSDISELNWKLFTYAEATVDSAHIEINLPANSYNADDVLIWGHGLTDGTIDVVSSSKIVMDIDDVKDNEFIEFRILMENSLFPNIDARNMVYTSEMNKAILMDYEADLADYYNKRIEVAQTLEYASIGLVVIMLGLSILIYFKVDKEFTPEFDRDYLRELPNEDSPVVVSYLYYMEKLNDEVVTATMLDLIRRKYIHMEYSASDMSDKDSDFHLTLNKDIDHSDLEEHEKQFIRWLFGVIGTNGQVSTSQIKEFSKRSEAKAIQYQNELKKFMKISKQVAKSKKYFISGTSMNKGKLLGLNAIPVLFGIVSVILFMQYYINIMIPLGASIVSVIAFSVYVSGIKKRTREGNEMFAQWKAFKNFLVDFSNMEDYPIPGIIVWEHFLVYATVFDIADTVMKQLEIKLPEEEKQSNDSTFLYVGYGRHRYYHHGVYRQFDHSFKTAKNNARNTIASARAARAKSSGGGFGGGSSFGGGGGGGRSR